MKTIIILKLLIPKILLEVIYVSLAKLSQRLSGSKTSVRGIVLWTMYVLKAELQLSLKA
jgi:hypothetical protein